MTTADENQFETNPHSDLPFSEQVRLMNEEGAELHHGSDSHLGDLIGGSTDQKACTPEEPVKAQNRVMCGYVEMIPHIIVITHIDSFGKIAKQNVLENQSNLKAFMRKNYRDFSTDTDELIQPGKQHVYTCCFDHIVVANVRVE